MQEYANCSEKAAPLNLKFEMGPNFHRVMVAVYLPITLVVLQKLDPLLIAAFVCKNDMTNFSYVYFSFCFIFFCFLP